SARRRPRGQPGAVLTCGRGQGRRCYQSLNPLPGTPPRPAAGPFGGLLRGGGAGFGGVRCLAGGRRSGRGRGWRSGLGGDRGLAGALTTAGGAAGWTLGLGGDLARRLVLGRGRGQKKLEAGPGCPGARALESGGRKPPSGTFRPQRQPGGLGGGGSRRPGPASAEGRRRRGGDHSGEVGAPSITDPGGRADPLAELKQPLLQMLYLRSTISRVELRKVKGGQQRMLKCSESLWFLESRRLSLRAF
ncbi:hypothetical protein MC885_002471, partial [Smutsia gigantea]